RLHAPAAASQRSLLPQSTTDSLRPDLGSQASSSLPRHRNPAGEQSAHSGQAGGISSGSGACGSGAPGSGACGSGAPGSGASGGEVMGPGALAVPASARTPLLGTPFASSAPRPSSLAG